MIHATGLINATIDRIAPRSRLLRLEPFDALRRRAITARRRAFEPTSLDGDAASLLKAMIESGVGTIGHVRCLLGEGITVVGAVIDEGMAGWTWGGATLLESEDVLRQRADLYLLGLEPRMLDLAEAYIGEPCFYLGCVLKREPVSPSTAGTRRWHLDIEDDRMLRLIVYLNDVDTDGGPFEYIDPDYSRIARAHLRYRSGYVVEDSMRSVVSESRWHKVLGAAGTVMAFDGTRIFHRAGRPTRAPRLSLTITYSSRHPRQILRPVRLRADSRRALLDQLSSRQRASIPGGRWL